VHPPGLQIFHNIQTAIRAASNYGKSLS
jgi:hypothetical protein